VTVVTLDTARPWVSSPASVLDLTTAADEIDRASNQLDGFWMHHFEDFWRFDFNPTDLGCLTSRQRRIAEQRSLETSG